MGKKRSKQIGPSRFPPPSNRQIFPFPPLDNPPLLYFTATQGFFCHFRKGGKKSRGGGGVRELVPTVRRGGAVEFFRKKNLGR